MEKPSGICIYSKDQTIDEAFYVRTTDLNEAIKYYTAKFGYGFDMAEMTFLFFYERPFRYVYMSDLFNN